MSSMRNQSIVVLDKGADEERAVYWRIVNFGHICTIEPVRPIRRTVPMNYWGGGWVIESSDPIDVWKQHLILVDGDGMVPKGSDGWAVKQDESVEG